MNIKIWNAGQQEWQDVDMNNSINVFEEDGYCACSICQKQKKEEEKKEKEKLHIPDELFEMGE